MSTAPQETEHGLPKGSGGGEPFLRCREGDLPGFSETREISVFERSIVCVGAAGTLVQALLPGETNGSVLIDGQKPEHLLRSGIAGYCPCFLNSATTLSVGRALLSSARLIGLSKGAVETALDRCGLGDLRKRKVDSLSLCEQRLLGLSHGLCGEPKILFIEDLFVGLDDDDALRVSRIVVPALSDRAFIMSGDTGAARFRALWPLSAALLFEEAGRLRGPIAPFEFLAASHWVTTLDSARSFAHCLREAGVRVCRTPNDHSLLVEAGASLVLELAARAGVKIVRLTPTEHAPFVYERARSEP